MSLNPFKLVLFAASVVFLAVMYVVVLVEDALRFTYSQHKERSKNS